MALKKCVICSQRKDTSYAIADKFLGKDLLTIIVRMCGVQAANIPKIDKVRICQECVVDVFQADTLTEKVRRTFDGMVAQSPLAKEKAAPPAKVVPAQETSFLTKFKDDAAISSTSNTNATANQSTGTAPSATAPAVTAKPRDISAATPGTPAVVENGTKKAPKTPKKSSVAKPSLAVGNDAGESGQSLAGSTPQMSLKRKHAEMMATDTPQSAKVERDSVSIAFSCTLCPFETDVAKHFKLHLTTTHGVLKPRIYVCSHCPDTYVRVDALQRHMEKMHRMKRAASEPAGSGTPVKAKNPIKTEKDGAEGSAKKRCTNGSAKKGRPRSTIDNGGASNSVVSASGGGSAKKMRAMSVVDTGSANNSVEDGSVGGSAKKMRAMSVVDTGSANNSVEDGSVGGSAKKMRAMSVVDTGSANNSVEDGSVGGSAKKIRISSLVENGGVSNGSVGGSAKKRRASIAVFKGGASSSAESSRVGDNGSVKAEESGGDEFECPNCPYKTKVAKYYRKHLVVHHQIAKPRIHQCRMCTETYQRIDALHRHIENVHCVKPNGMPRNSESNATPQKVKLARDPTSDDNEDNDVAGAEQPDGTFNGQRFNGDNDVDAEDADGAHDDDEIGGQEHGDESLNDDKGSDNSIEIGKLNEEVDKILDEINDRSFSELNDVDGNGAAGVDTKHAVENGGSADPKESMTRPKKLKKKDAANASLKKRSPTKAKAKAKVKVTVTATAAAAAATKDEVPKASPVANIGSTTGSNRSACGSLNMSDSRAESEHQSSDSSRPSKKSVCVLCGKVCTGIKEMRVHMEKSHMVGSRKSCPNCSKSFSTVAKYELHVFNEKCKGSVHVCHVASCAMRFVRLSELRQHMRLKHINDSAMETDHCA